MKPRLTAILLHGMGQSPSWWAPFVPGFERLGITVLTPAIPDLSVAAPEDWVQAAVDIIPDSPAILMGHSLGAAVALRAAWRKPVEGVILLAMPVQTVGSVPPPPRGITLSLAASSRIGRFLIGIAADLAKSTAEAIHLVGDCDHEIDVDAARQLPVPLVCLPGAGHGLNSRESDILAITARVACTPAAQRWLDPAARRSACMDARLAENAADLVRGSSVPPPARLDVEATTRCQLSCVHCARTLHGERQAPVDMPPALFERVLDEAEFADEVIFVGLGEPLLHPALDRIVRITATRGLRSKVVTNGLAADRESLARLRDSGLREITFSIDTTDPGRFAALRAGASLDTVLRNFGDVPAGLRKSIFATLSRTNAADLGGLAGLARAHGLPVLAASDVNFEENAGDALCCGGVDDIVNEGLRRARAAGVLVVGPHLHEVCDVAVDYRHCLVRSATDLSGRSPKHTYCLAPWRIAVVGANGEITPCNCAPQWPVGSLERSTLSQVWEGSAMREWRAGVANGTNRHCRVCPRF